MPLFSSSPSDDQPQATLSGVALGFLRAVRLGDIVASWNSSDMPTSWFSTYGKKRLKRILFDPQIVAAMWFTKPLYVFPNPITTLQLPRRQAVPLSSSRRQAHLERGRDCRDDLLRRFIIYTGRGPLFILLSIYSSIRSL